MRTVSTTGRLVPALLAGGCMLVPSADARWRTGATSEHTVLEICRDGMRVTHAESPSTDDPDHAGHAVPADVSDRYPFVVVTNPPPSPTVPSPPVIYEDVQLSRYSPIDLAGGGLGAHYDFHGTYTIRWSPNLVDPNDPAPFNKIGIDFDGSAGDDPFDYSVNDCYLSMAANGKIAFQSNRDDANFEIYSMWADDATLQQIRQHGGTPATQRLTNNSTFDLSPTWSPDGTKIAFESHRNDNYDIYVMDATGDTSTNPATRITTNNAASDLNPAWSPDGTKIAFTSNRHGNSEIYAVDASGETATNVTRLTTDPATDREPAWSPDGTQIAFESDRNPHTGNYEIYKVNTDGAGLARLTGRSVVDRSPYWSPDGGQIGFNTFEGVADEELYAMGSDGSLPGPLTADPVAGDNSANRPQSGAWSPDSLRMALSALGDGDFEIYVTPPGVRVALFGPPGAPASARPGSLKLTNNTFTDGEPDWQRNSGYPRPKAASPIRVSLVPAYTECTLQNANRFHGPPLNHPDWPFLDGDSCNPPQQRSSFLTVGTPDANSAGANSAGSAKLAALPGDPATTADEADVRLDMSITDVRCKPGATPCGSANAADGPDYTGQLLVNSLIRITDKFNGPTQSAPGTTVDLPFTYAASCAATSSTAVGSTCSATTSADMVTPGSIQELKRAIRQFGQIEVYDGGSDGLASTLPNNVFAKQGIFVP